MWNFEKDYMYFFPLGCGKPCGTVIDSPFKGPCPGFCGGSSMLNGYCCSKDASGTLRCPKSAKLAVTSETNSCITLNDIQDDDDFISDESDDDDDDDSNTMVIKTPQVSYYKKY